MNVVILDAYTVNPSDLSWDPIIRVGTTTIYDRTADSEIVSRARDAEVLVVNKVRITREHLKALPSVKAICLLATGYDNVDVTAAKEFGIRVYNAVGYGTESVAQHTFAMILAFTNRVESHHRSVQQGTWSAQDDFSYSLHTVQELKGKTLGIIGYGKIGQRVAELAGAFGMEILAVSRSGAKEGVRNVDRDELFRQSDFITLHAPLNEATREMINRQSLSVMRPNAVIVNTGRGALINEDDLREALYHQRIGGAVLDVLSIEPPAASNRLCQMKNVWITPHMAWRSLQAREALIRIVADNINHYRHGENINRVV
jgi:glycerate dehydrogenase